MDEYRVPKREVPAEVTVIGLPPAAKKLFVSVQAEGHAGGERPSDLLNGVETFLPARDGDGKVRFLQRDAVAVVSVSADSEADGDPSQPDGIVPAPASTAEVEVTLESGTRLKGVVTYAMPAGRGRLQDFLNLGERFLALRQDGRVHLINKLRIARIAQV